MHACRHLTKLLLFTVLIKNGSVFQEPTLPVGNKNEHLSMVHAILADCNQSAQLENRRDSRISCDIFFANKSNYNQIPFVHIQVNDSSYRFISMYIYFPRIVYYFQNSNKTFLIKYDGCIV